MRAPQRRQRPRSHRYESSGRLSYQRTGVWQLGQCELGCTIDSSRGRRWITTFRNEPTISPSTSATPAHAGGYESASAMRARTSVSADV